MSAVDRANLYAAYLSDFMEKNTSQVYSESIGAEFLKDLSPRFSAETNGNLKLFIARVNAILRQERFVTHVKTSEPIKLPASFENILTDYIEHCKAKGLHSSTIRKREFCCRAFLNSLAHTGIHGNIEITASAISKACLRVSHNSYFPIIRMFLKFLFEANHLKKDYSFVIPHFKTPQPMPSVYSMQEVRQIPVRLQMLLGGMTDSALLPEPLATMVETKGARTVWDDTGLDEPLAVIALRAPYLKPEVVKPFRAALRDAARRIDADPEKYRALMVEKGLLPKPAAASYNMVRFDLFGTPDGMPPLPTREDMERVEGWMSSRGMLKNAPAYEEIIFPPTPEAEGEPR